MIDTDTVTGLILHLQRLSTEDGPGLRTTVFYKGCPLHCLWCHNPESINPGSQVQWISVRCIGCDSCMQVCQHGALTHTETGIIRDRSLCTACGACVEACPAGAMEMLGAPTSVSELVYELNKDRAYFEKSAGGVTLSGGEPTLQPRFTMELVQQLKESGLSVALDTCALCSSATLNDLFPLVDAFLVDLKLINPTEHQHWTGYDMTPVTRNSGSARRSFRVPLLPRPISAASAHFWLLKFQTSWNGGSYVHSITSAAISMPAWIWCGNSNRPL
jgi:pyruvate formate lyase activating enzyme